MRALLALSVLAVIAAGGCRMCASPYDYCGPVLEDGCTNCGSGYGGPMPMREGSIEESTPMMERSSGQPTPAVAPAPKPYMQTPNGSMPSASRPSNSPGSTPRTGARSTSTRFAYGDPDERQSAVQHWQNYQR